MWRRVDWVMDINLLDESFASVFLVEGITWIFMSVQDVK
jgi:hypothetical protein